MLTLQDLPPHLAPFLGGEQIDFIVKTKRKYARNGGMYFMLFFGIVWCLFISVFLFTLVLPLISGETIPITINGEPTVGSRTNLTSLSIPLIIISIASILGLGLITSSLYHFFAPGGYFIGTSRALVFYQNGNIKLTPWSQFTQNMEIKERNDYGFLHFQLYSGTVRKTKSSSYFAPDTITMQGISSATHVFENCRRHIQEVSGQDLATVTIEKD